MPFGVDSPTVPSVTVKTPLRCVRCKAYVNPYFKFDGTGNITCNICGHRYVSHEKIDQNILNSTDVYTSGVLDFKVSDPLYFKKDFSKVKILVLIEMTKNTIETGVFTSVLESVKSTITSFQFDAGVRLSIVTYNQASTFYRVRNL
jgi:protein transport protein SEC24